MLQIFDVILAFGVNIWAVVILAAGFMPCLAELFMAVLHLKASIETKRELGSSPAPANNMEWMRRMRRLREARHLACCAIVYLILSLEHLIEVMSHYGVHLSLPGG